MRNLVKLFSFLFLLSFSTLQSQNFNQEELTFIEYLGYVKKYHPLVKQANLEVTNAQAKLMLARGGFDPKIEVDYNKKEFKGTEYYSLLNSSFKIPTWYGIEVKAGFDDAEGQYLNPQNKTPEAGLTSLGVSVALGQGMFINQRMADVREGKLNVKLSDAQRKLRAIEVLYQASEAYFEWRKSYNEAELYKNYLGFASTRFEGVKKLIAAGDAPAIDSVEAKITVRNRELNVENGNLKLAKAKLKLANFLWIENVPVELGDLVKPEQNLIQTIEETLKTDAMMVDVESLDSHPKIQSLETKMDILEVNRQLKANSLLPKINVGYNYISEPNYWNNFNADDYKFNIDFSFPIFLRKERGSLKMAKLKIQDMQFDIGQQRLELKNKIKAQQTEIASLRKQKVVIDNLVKDYMTMLNSEEKLFSFGESSIFLINSRENNLVSAKLSQISLENQFYLSNAELYKILANPD
ncbi:MAG: TolC family protein [Flavobacterium nitrogenifigens]|uniref:Outer membrane protein TolC n=1 Tax=Flavobacterium nitrogenifigens TaxID=1617283 RepID=A0A521DPB0_9FLAO|nr:TolC family protein [Flavobacterium nitrogenifigens]KAF2339686.1 TolC family protein [Flavobacterium nitrogenifigens]MDQ8012562.1 TolC family protein [Flavobacterium nitrogenifigens]SMO73544.1 Outer membrane protein TolC [Flavobacterium nitrogenifigens]